MNRITVLSILSAVSLIMASFWFTSTLSAAEEKLVALAYPAYWTSPDNRELIPATVDQIRNNELPEMRIVERNGEYFWASNGDVPLIRTEKTVKHARFDVEYKYSVFTNPDGEGMVIIRHDPNDEEAGMDVCHMPVPSHNYAEYRINGEGKLTGFYGPTRPYPWPKPHKYCGKSIKQKWPWEK